MNENNITIINQSIHKNLTNNHLAQINFVAIMPQPLFDKYIEKTSLDHENLGRIRFMQISNDLNGNIGKFIRVFGRVSHGYGYGIEQDIFNSIDGAK
jgi:hypothetical protein